MFLSPEMPTAPFNSLVFTKTNRSCNITSNKSFMICLKDACSKRSVMVQMCWELSFYNQWKWLIPHRHTHTHTLYQKWADISYKPQETSQPTSQPHECTATVWTQLVQQLFYSFIWYTQLKHCNDSNVFHTVYVQLMMGLLFFYS